MKQTRELEAAQEQMRPGVIARDGFLGRDSVKLGDLLTEDDARVKRLGLTHTRIAESMRAFREAGRRGLGQGVSVPPHHEVAVEAVRGMLPCPFQDGIFRKINTRVRNLESGREVTFTDLNIHLIEAHGFYEGPGSPFRQEPAVLAQVLGIDPEREG